MCWLLVCFKREKKNVSENVLSFYLTCWAFFLHVHHGKSLFKPRSTGIKEQRRVEHNVYLNKMCIYIYIHVWSVIAFRMQQENVHSVLCLAKWLQQLLILVMLLLCAKGPKVHYEMWPLTGSVFTKIIVEIGSLLQELRELEQT